LLGQAIEQYPGSAVLPLLPELEALVERALSVPLTGVQFAGSGLLACICQVSRHRGAEPSGLYLSHRR